VHGDERPSSAPSRIALGMSQVLWCNHYVTKRGFSPTRKEAADARRACGQWYPNKQSTVRPNRSNDITCRCGKDKQCRCNFSNADSILRGTKCAVTQQHKAQTEQYARATMSTTSQNHHLG
jgi:hypothetical protein